MLSSPTDGELRRGGVCSGAVSHLGKSEETGGGGGGAEIAVCFTEITKCLRLRSTWIPFARMAPKISLASGKFNSPGPRLLFFLLLYYNFESKRLVSIFGQLVRRLGEQKVTRRLSSTPRVHTTLRRDYFSTRYGSMWYMGKQRL